jgi:phage gpG-like protein
MDISVKVDAGRVVASLGAFRASVAQRGELLTTIGAGQLVSIRRTFAEEGPGWAPLSKNSLRWSHYTAGHKLLIGRGRLINSINAQVQGSTVAIGTNVKYAPVHQRGFDGTQSVAPYQYSRSVSTRDAFRKEAIVNKAGRNQTVTRKVASGVSFVHVGGFTRHIVIPARPFLVFRPEDPARIAGEVRAFMVLQAKNAGLEAK